MRIDTIDIAHDPDRTVLYFLDQAHASRRIEEGVLVTTRMREAFDAVEAYSGRRLDPRETHEWHCSDGGILAITPRVVAEGVEIAIQVWLDGDVHTASMRGIGGPPSDPDGPPAALWCLNVPEDDLMTMARQALDWMEACLDAVDQPCHVGPSHIDAVLRGAAWTALDALGGDDRFSVDVIAPTPWTKASIWVTPFKESIPHHDRIQEIVAPLNRLTPCMSMITGDWNLSLGVHGPDIDPSDIDPVTRMRDLSAYQEFVRRSDGGRR